jgi:hypothetical protein
VSKPKPCKIEGCEFPKMQGRHFCGWHWLLKQPQDVQASYARGRLERVNDEYRARVPSDEWPEGHRWCAGCQSFVPLFYATGSRCRSCASEAAHAQRVSSVYGITKLEYEAMFKLQEGRCFICGRKSNRRLAVDHDHKDGNVRGLLCPDIDRGCNKAVLGNLEANAIDNGLAAARRLVEYLEDPPYARVSRGVTAPERSVVPPRKPVGQFPVPLPVDPPF